MPPPARLAAEVGWCRDALAYLPPSSFVRWCGWARTRCLSVRAASDDPRIPIELNVMTVDQYSVSGACMASACMHLAGGYVRGRALCGGALSAWLSGRGGRQAGR